MGRYPNYDFPCCYFYENENKEIVYIGKANCTLPERVRAHKKEDKFETDKHNYTIYYQKFNNSADMDIAEKVYIKSFKPKLNIIGNTEGFFPIIPIDFSLLFIYNEEVPPPISDEKHFCINCSHQTNNIYFIVPLDNGGKNIDSNKVWLCGACRKKIIDSMASKIKKTSIKKSPNPTGRPKVSIPDNFLEVIERWHKEEITAVKAANELGMARTTFYKVVKEKGLGKNLIIDNK